MNRYVGWVAASAVLLLGGCVAVPVGYYEAPPAAYYYSAPSVSVGVHGGRSHGGYRRGWRHHHRY
jgi:hypothetical protein